MKFLKILISILFVLSLCSCQTKPSEADAISESYQSALSSIEFTVNEQLDMIDYILCNNYFDDLNIDGILAEGVEQYTYNELEEYLEEDSKNIAYLKEELSNASSNISELKTEIEELKREYELELEDIREEYKKR